VRIEETELAGLIVLTPRRFGDDRGWFAETWNAATLREAGIELDFVQDNHSFSARKGTLRGLHYQSPPRAQGKLVRCTRGAVFDVAIDVRVGSPTFGRHASVELTPETGAQLLVPGGFLHGFVTLTDDTEVQYKCTDFYSAECDGAVHWDSAGIDWPGTDDPVVSAKDAGAPAFADWTSPFRMEDFA